MHYRQEALLLNVGIRGIFSLKIDSFDNLLFRFKIFLSFDLLKIHFCSPLCDASPPMLRKMLPLLRKARPASPDQLHPPTRIYTPFAFASRTLTESGPLFDGDVGLGMEILLPRGLRELRSRSKSWLKEDPCFPRRIRGVLGLLAMNLLFC